MEEVARDLPTTIVAAHEDLVIAEQVQEIFTNPVMRVYTNTDVKGVELCGALLLWVYLLLLVMVIIRKLL